RKSLLTVMVSMLSGSLLACSSAEAEKLKILVVIAKQIVDLENVIKSHQNKSRGMYKQDNFDEYYTKYINYSG
ncbi:MAG: hypothetical protein ACI9U5_000641, partial [Colwellia sp.]